MSTTTIPRPLRVPAPSYLTSRQAKFWYETGFDPLAITIWRNAQRQPWWKFWARRLPIGLFSENRLP